MNSKQPSAKTRSDILSLLSEACELEHGLACSYLYAAFSLKQSVYENELSWEQLQYTRKWAGQIYFIASQEMFHLSQAWNLLTAIGGTPYYMRPNFPQTHRYYPIDLPLLLEPFSKKALKRFIFYELPTHVSDEEFLMKEFHIPAARINNAFTVGKLYDTILAGIRSIPEKELFIGDPGLQVGPETCHFNDIVKVTDHASAQKAIMTITEQGEGTTKGKDMPADQVDCHYGLFIKIEEEYEEIEKLAEKTGVPFKPAREVINNPVPVFHLGDIPHNTTRISDVYSSGVAALFDHVYSLMLKILQYVFQAGPQPGNSGQKLADISIQLMTRALKPLAEALTLLPAGADSPGETCGPAFGLYRHVSFPVNISEINVLVKEELSNIVANGKSLAADAKAPVPLTEGVDKLSAILQLL